MSDLDALLAGIVADPANAVRWLVMADWLEDHGQPERAELVRVHRELLRNCTATRETKARKQLHARMMELMRAGVQPCLPQRTIALPGGVELRMSFIPPGSFLMGSLMLRETFQTDEPRHRVMLTKGFWLGVSPVTQAQWHAVTGNNPSHFKGDELPVECVSWDDARAYCESVCKFVGSACRLPTEAEWEYAARSGTGTPYYWGAELNGTQANCHGGSPYGTDVPGPSLVTTTAVGSFAAVSPHPWGLTDVHGNVWEWCADWDGDYPTGQTVDPTGPTDGNYRIARGGGWGTNPVLCRAAARTSDPIEEQSFDLGFRLAATA